MKENLEEDLKDKKDMYYFSLYKMLKDAEKLGLTGKQKSQIKSLMKKCTN